MHIIFEEDGFSKGQPFQLHEGGCDPYRRLKAEEDFQSRGEWLRNQEIRTAYAKV